MRLKVDLESNLDNQPGWDSAIPTTTGTGTANVANLTDWDTSTATDVVLDVITAFTDLFPYSSGNYVTGVTEGWEELVWGQFAYNSDLVTNPAAVIDLRSTSATPTLVPGNSYVVRLGGAWGDDARDIKYTVNGVTAVYNNITQAKPWVPPAPVEITAVATDDGTGKGVLRVTAEEPDGGGRNYLAAIEVTEAATSSPTITDINTNNEVVPGTTATLTGTNLTGATGFNIGSEAQTAFTVVSDTSITFTTVRGGNPYNQNLTGTLLHPDGNQTITVQQVPEAGTFAVTAASPNTTDDASLWTGLIDTATSDPITIVDGDQAWVKNPNNLTNLAIAPDGTITADETGDFVVQIWLASEGVWGSDQTVTFTVPSAPGIGIAFNKRVQLSIGVGL